MTLNKKVLSLIFCILCLFFSLTISGATEKPVSQEIRGNSKQAVEEIKDIGKEIGKEGKKIGHDVKEGSKSAWESIKDLFNQY